MPRLSNLLIKVQTVSKTAAYRTTFDHTGLLARRDDARAAVEDKAASCLTAFAKERVLKEIVTNIGGQKLSEYHLPVVAACLSVSHSSMHVHHLKTHIMPPNMCLALQYCNKHSNCTYHVATCNICAWLA